MQAGRIGSDFEERLDRSKLDFRWEMLQKIEVAIEGISAAMGKGMAQKTKSEQQVDERKKGLVQTAEKLDELRGRLMRIRTAAGSAAE